MAKYGRRMTDAEIRGSGGVLFQGPGVGGARPRGSQKIYGFASYNEMAKMIGKAFKSASQGQRVYRLPNGNVASKRKRR